MSSIIFQGSDNTLIFDNIGLVTESGIHWAVLNGSSYSSISTIEDSGTNLNLTNGAGTITTTASTGTKLLVLQSPSTLSIGAYVVTIV